MVGLFWTQVIHPDGIHGDITTKRGRSLLLGHFSPEFVPSKCMLILSSPHRPKLWGYPSARKNTVFSFFFFRDRRATRVARHAVPSSHPFRFLLLALSLSFPFPFPIPFFVRNAYHPPQDTNRRSFLDLTSHHIQSR